MPFEGFLRDLEFCRAAKASRRDILLPLDLELLEERVLLREVAFLEEDREGIRLSIPALLFFGDGFGRAIANIDRIRITDFGLYMASSLIIGL